jgi:hypothetical protein
LLKSRSDQIVEGRAGDRNDRGPHQNERLPFIKWIARGRLCSDKRMAGVLSNPGGHERGCLLHAHIANADLVFA